MVFETQNSKEIFFFNVHTSSESHPASYPMRTGAFTLEEVKAAEALSCPLTSI
jgi:hypothetical protein